MRGGMPGGSGRVSSSSLHRLLSVSSMPSRCLLGPCLLDLLGVLLLSWIGSLAARGTEVGYSDRDHEDPSRPADRMTDGNCVRTGTEKE